MRVEVLVGELVVHSQELQGPLHVGRSSANGLILRDGGVSGHHAVFVSGEEGVSVTDLGSTNGTFVNEQRIAVSTPLQPGDVVRLGTTARVRLAGSAPEAHGPLTLEQVDGPVAWAVDRSPFPVPGKPEWLLLVGEDEVWLAVDGTEERKLELGNPFGGFVLRESAESAATVRPGPTALPYELEVSLSDRRASLTAGEQSCVFRVENRVTLLYALGRRWLLDGSRGWMDDDELGIAVWGRSYRELGRNNLNVLVHRVRKQAESKGLERWFLERRTGQLRLRVSAVGLG